MTTATVAQNACSDSLAKATLSFASNNIVLTAQQLAAAGKRVAPGDYRRAELAGVCFDPSGSVLFMNAYSPGITFAIQGPWNAGRCEPRLAVGASCDAAHRHGCSSIAWKTMRSLRP